LLQANFIFMGPGSPSYTARQLRGTLAWDIIRARHRQGATLVFASAATISVGQWVLPVYEIYKVGEDVHVKDGLGLLLRFWHAQSPSSRIGTMPKAAWIWTPAAVLSAWNALSNGVQLTPPENVIVGLDEHSGVIIDFEKKSVMCMGSVRSPWQKTAGHGDVSIRSKIPFK
jgi:hypothetical protein